MERQGASHRITQTRPGSAAPQGVRKTRLMGSWQERQPGNITGPMGTATATRSTRDEMYGAEMTTWHGPSGHTATVEEAGHYDRQGQEFHNYVAGPYRTQHRAQIAAQAIADRPEAKKEQYRRGSHRASWEEMRPDFPY